MIDVEYLNAQKRLMTAAMMIATIDLDAFLARIDHAETLAPIIDPVLFRRAQPNLSAIKQLAETARAFQTAAQELGGALIQTGIQEHERKEHHGNA